MTRVSTFRLHSLGLASANGCCTCWRFTPRFVSSLLKTSGRKWRWLQKVSTTFVCFLLLVCLIWIKAPYIPSVLFRGMLAAKYRMWLVLLNSCDWNTHCCLFCLRPYFALVTNASIGQCLVESTQLHVWVRQGRLKGGTWTRRNVSSWLRVQTARMPSLGPTSSTLSGASVTPTAASTPGHPPSDRGQVRG